MGDKKGTEKFGMGFSCHVHSRRTLQQQIIIILFIVFLDAELSGNSYVVMVVIGPGFESLRHALQPLSKQLPVLFFPPSLVHSALRRKEDVIYRV